MSNSSKGHISEEVVESIPTIQPLLVYINDEACVTFKWIVLSIAGLMTSTFGSVTNIINIICFAKQGFQDSVNVNFFALAISDLGSLLTMTIASVGYTPPLQHIDQPVDVVEMIYLTVGWPHIVFARITSWTTAFITLERCLCITMPLKVKTFITPQRAVVTNICLYIIVIGSVSPVYYANSYGWKFSPERNETILGLVFTTDRVQVEEIAFAVNHVILPFTAFLVVIVCTITLVINLRQKSKWRKKSTSVKQANTVNDRDLKLGRTIVIIATIFIISYIPVCLIFVAAIFVPGLSFDGHNKNLLIVCGGVGALLEEINSSVNIFIYYHMSSKYKQVFCELFPCFEKENT